MDDRQFMGAILAATFVCAIAVFWVGTSTLSTVTRAYKEKFASDAQISLRNMFVYIDTKQLISLNVIGLIALTLIAYLLSRSVVLAALVFGFSLLIPSFLFALFKRRRMRAITEQLPDAILLIAGALRAGSSLQIAISQMAAEIRPPISQEFFLLLREQRFGISFEDALDNLEKRIPNEEFMLVCAAMKVSRETGGNLAETLERLADTIRNKITIEGKIRALTAQGKLQGIVVGALPLLLVLVLFQMEPAAMAPLLHTWYGWLVIALIVVLEFIGALIIRKIVNIDV